jgi:hypothetical protein
VDGSALNTLQRSQIFTEISVKLSEFHPLMDFKEGETETESEDADACGRIAALEEKADQHSHFIAKLQDKVTQLSTDFGFLVGEVSALRSGAVRIQTLSNELSALQTQITRKTILKMFSLPKLSIVAS